MIYELMKRDPAWKAMPWIVLVSAVACASPSPVSNYGAIAVVMGLVVAGPHRRAIRFDAGLPIAGRDLILARALSLMAVFWLPAMAGAAAAAISSGRAAAAVTPLAMAALCTLAAGVLQSIRVRELAVTGWTRAHSTLSALFGSSMLTLIAGLYGVRDPATALIPATCCALAGIALLAWTWSAVPKSFELAPAKPRAGDGPPRLTLQYGISSPRLVWLPVLRSVFSLMYSMMLLMALDGAFEGEWRSSGFWILFAWMTPRQNTLWLRPLPVRPRALLVAMVAPILLVLAGGRLAGFPIGPVPALPLQVFNLGALLGWALILVLVSALFDWRRLSRVLRMARPVVLIVLVAGPYVGGHFWRGGDPLHLAALRLAQALPNSVALALALVAAVLGALWWAIEKVFAEAEHADKPRAPRQEYFAG